LKPKVAGKKFVLRIFGYREYLIGSPSILSYDRIRLILRGVKSLQVVLTEINKKKLQNTNSLPIIERESTTPPSVEVKYKKMPFFFTVF
jgi:phosphatidylinositol-4,5-bisphosphate 3-kinase